MQRPANAIVYDAVVTAATTPMLGMPPCERSRSGSTECCVQSHQTAQWCSYCVGLWAMYSQEAVSA